MEFKKKLFRIIGILLCLVTVGVIGVLTFSIMQRAIFDILSLLIDGIVILVPFFLGIGFLTYSIKDEKRRRLVLKAEWIITAAYIIVLLELLFGGMRLSSIGLGEFNLKNRILYQSNFIPFKTIVYYVRCMFTNEINANIPIENLFGNLLMFLPAGMVSPCLFNKLRTWKQWIPKILVILVLIEVLQLFMPMSCSTDIDDVILNMTGACIGFAIVKNKHMYKLMQKVYLIN